MNRVHGMLAAAAAIMGGAAAVADLNPSADPARLAEEIASERDHISAPDLAGHIMRGDDTLRIFDLRSAREFEEFHIPTARRISIEALAKESLPRQANIVLYSEGGAHAAQAWVLLRMRGYRSVLFLREGIYEWLSRVVEPRLADDATPAERAEFEKAAPLSRFFGGTPRTGVPRAEVPTGYWTGESATTTGAPVPTGPIRRRGC
jgi:rhodanese-related sulfurtransferase